MQLRRLTLGRASCRSVEYTRRGSASGIESDRVKCLPGSRALRCMKRANPGAAGKEWVAPWTQAPQLTRDVRKNLERAKDQGPPTNWRETRGDVRFCEFALPSKRLFIWRCSHSSAIGSVCVRGKKQMRFAGQKTGARFEIMIRYLSYYGRHAAFLLGGS